VSLDYLAFDRAHARAWIPVGDTGSVDVFDVATRGFTRVDGFPTAERESHGKKRIAGPSSVAIGDGFAYVGNRATSEVCAVDVSALKIAGCTKLGSPPDGIATVATTREVWVTTPRDHSITILDAATPGAPTVKATVQCGGAVEGYGVDLARGRFFTNLEDKGSTLVIDLASRAITATYDPHCGSDGPRGLAVDPTTGMIVVACTDHLQVLDVDHAVVLASKLDTGAGVDNIDFAKEKRLIVAAAGKASRLTFAHLDEQGLLSVAGVVTTSEGTRNVVADGAGNAYVADAAGARLLVVAAPTP
jgi:DNA-binding beta-propeller fold protein YncE